MPTAVSIRPRALLQQARELAEHQTGAGRPRPEWLRRAVSTAYYAVFHDVALRVSRHLLPQGSQADRRRLCRSIGHRELREVCESVKKPKGRAHYRPIIERLHQDQQLARLAESIADLQEQRHQADYDHLEPFSKERVLLALEVAETALNDLDALQDHASPHEFFALIALQTKLR